MGQRSRPIISCYFFTSCSGIEKHIKNAQSFKAACRFLGFYTECDIRQLIGDSNNFKDNLPHLPPEFTFEY